MVLTRKRIVTAGIAIGILVIGGSAWAVLGGSSSEIDSARLATVERGAGLTLLLRYRPAD
jgi:hypothetical protein